MSEEQLKAFLEKVKADTSLQEKLKAASDPNAVVAIAKEAGVSISADVLKQPESEVSDQELEGAAGGGQEKASTNWAITGVCGLDGYKTGVFRLC